MWWDDFDTPAPLLWMPGKSSADGTHWLPLWVHLEDTAGVAERLVSQWIPMSVCDQIGKEADVVSVCRFLALTHDIGKATPAFLSRILPALPDHRGRLERLISIPETLLWPEKSSHALAGEVILLDMECPAGLSAVVGAHHGKPQDECECDNQLDIYSQNYFGKGGRRGSGAAGWTLLRQNWMAYALKDSGYASTNELPEISMPVQVLLTGILIVADWLASNDTYFPQISLEDNGQTIDFDFRLSDAWSRISLPDLWTPFLTLMDDESFRERFGFCPNAVQRSILTKVAQDQVPGLYILEAPMGIGKTEAALSAAEVLASRFGNGGIFFGLPTQATANGLFPRLRSWAEAQSEETVHAIRLAHGMAEMNDEYRQLFHGTARTAEDEDVSLIVHEWFSGRKQALLADFVIGTVDQLLMAGLKQKHLMLRHLGLAGKVIVIDECHAYDAYMNRYLDRALTWLGAYHTPVILLSATLPGKRRLELIEAYARHKVDRNTAVSVEKNLGYPLLTSINGHEVEQAVINADVPEKSVSIEQMNEEEAIAALRRVMEAGGCAGVILNTVSAAQRAARKLREVFADAEVLVFHSRFIAPDRAETECELMRRIGKHSTPETRRRLIVVGTQVLEQSLDIDFDLLITELCPMDLLLQRMGRLQRHNRVRPNGLITPLCGILEAGKGSESIYGEWLLYRTRSLLQKEAVLPRDIPWLVQHTYAELTDTERSIAAVETMWDEYQLSIKKKKSKAAAFTVGKPEPDTTLDGWLNTLVSDSEEGGQAAVRDIDDTIYVLLMQLTDEGKIRFLPWQNDGHPVAGDRIPSDHESRLIARQRVALPAVLSRGRTTYEKTMNQLLEMDRQYCAEWQQAPLLREERVLLLDEQNTIELNGYRITYTREDGLQYNKEGKDTNE